MENFTLEIDGDGIALITWDMPNRSMNVLSPSSMADIATWITQVAEDDAIKGAVLTSGKPAFCAGAELGGMQAAASGEGAPESEEERIRKMYERNLGFNNLLRTLETCGKPVVAAINGTALGGGLEVTLACHYRVASDNPRTQIGLPEAKVGLLPGGGGTQRLPRMIGIANALPLILQGKSLDPQKAAEVGIVQKVVAEGDLVTEAKRWIKEDADPVQPWDKKGFKIPGGGGPYDKGVSSAFVMGNAMLRKTTQGNFPAQQFIMSCVYEGSIVPIDAGLRIEARYFTKLLMHPASKNMIRSLFMSMQELGKGARRPDGVERAPVKKLGILGAGMMGAGVAYVSAKAGIEVVLLDTDLDNADRGKAYSAKLLDKAIKRGRSTEAKKEKLLAMITPTTNYEDLQGADLIIEAVFENREIKAEVTKASEPKLAPGGVFGSNTSTLPITGLAAASENPENFIGIHFFSPVDKMGLVEIIMGEKTSDAALAKAIDYVGQIRKTPIVVNDSRGFYTSRCFGTYVSEGVRMLSEGIKPALIENAGKQVGMPVAPLAMSDEVALDLAYKVREQTKKDLGDKYEASEADFVLEEMVVNRGRLGRKNGKGFYDYSEDGKKHLWPGLPEIVDVAEDQPDVEELKKRLLYIQAIETARCFDEKVVTDVRDADVGAILGWGFAPYTGGPISYIDTIGSKAFVAEADRLAQQYGPRFKPSKLLREMAEKDEKFYERFNPKAEAIAAE
jgi:3-hydroxyacyl-CoA dehydrogenase/enoyl-CoA hydratase/3-hydroxybutyryl-CoA epimerase